MCGAGVEQHYLDILQEEKEEELIDQSLVDNTTFVSFSFSTFTLRAPAHNS